jgi:phosphoribosylformylglycinamidine synthase
MATGAVISIQDMGAAGLTCSAVEMGDKGSLGIRLDLDRVPVREAGMTAYEMMLSESQERMLMVLRPEKEAEARAVFEKWDLDFAVVGETIPEDRFIVRLYGETMADLPLKALSGTAPEYDRPWVPTPTPAPLGPAPAVDPAEALLALMGRPNLCGRTWVWSQYDHMVMADTVLPPGSDAGVVRVHGTSRGIAFTSDVNPRYCRANPERGGAQAVAEAWRNLTATGAHPLAATDNLNFGNPERPEIMGQLVGCIKGIAAACTALDMPIVSGNVSLYNETEGSSILPTPTIGAVGLIERLDLVIRMAPRDGDRLLLLGDTRGHLGQSALLAEIFGREEGDAPPVDFAAERAAGTLLRNANADGLIGAAHDLSDGGLAVAAAEMALAGGIGVEVVADDLLSAAGWFYGEDQGRYLLACSPDAVGELMGRAHAAGVPLRDVGHAGGSDIRMGVGTVALDAIAAAHANGLALLLD